MKKNQEKLILADHYLHGEMSAEEKRTFEKQLSVDPELTRLVTFQKDLDKALMDREAIEFRDILNDVHRSYQQNRKVSVFQHQTFRIAGIAAVLGILIGLAFLLNHLLNREPLNKRIVAEFYQPYEVPVNYRSPAGTVDALFREAVEKYNSKQYKEAIRLFEQVLSEDKTRMDANLMNGLSNFEVNNYTGADSSFNRIIRHRDNLYFEQAQWYLGFCFLMTNQNRKAIELYQKIISQKGYYSRQAQKILNKLSS